MKRWWLEIELKSDMCPSSGDSEAGLIDTKVTLEHGFPLIPAKRIKGCLRNEAREMAANGVIPQNVLEGMFGNPGAKRPGKLYVGNATVYQIPEVLFGGGGEQEKLTVENYDQELERLASFTEFEEDWIENILTETRTRTAIDRETGSAKNTSLRTMQIIPRGMVFRSRVELYDGTDAELEALKWCVKALRHMGMGITRGFGEISCKLEELKLNSKENDSDEEKDFGSDELMEVSYEIELKAPVLFPGEAGIYEDCSEQIPGASLLGAFAAMYIEDNKLGKEAHTDTDFRRIFLEDGVEFGYGFLTVDGQTFYPCPACLAREKASDKAIINRFEEGKEKVRRREIGSHISWQPDKGTICLADVEKEVRMHHKRPMDRGIGHALNDRIPNATSDMGQFYQYTCLSRGQKFRGRLRGKKKDVSKLLKCVEKREGRLRLGRSRTAEYGEAVFRTLGQTIIRKADEGEKKAKAWIIWLLTPMVLVDGRYGDIRSEQELFINQLKECFNCDFKIKDQILKYGKIGGYNSKWRLPQPQSPVLMPGSVLWIEADRKLAVSELEKRRWGGDSGKGCGQIKAIPYELVGGRELTLSSSEKQEEKSDFAESSLVRRLQDCKNAEKKKQVEGKAGGVDV